MRSAAVPATPGAAAPGEAPPGAATPGAAAAEPVPCSAAAFAAAAPAPVSGVSVSSCMTAWAWQGCSMRKGRWRKGCSCIQAGGQARRSGVAACQFLGRPRGTNAAIAAQASCRLVITSCVTTVSGRVPAVAPRSCGRAASAAPSPSGAPLRPATCGGRQGRAGARGGEERGGGMACHGRGGATASRGQEAAHSRHKVSCKGSSSSSSGLFYLEVEHRHSVGQVVSNVAGEH